MIVSFRYSFFPPLFLSAMQSASSTYIETVFAPARIANINKHLQLNVNSKNGETVKKNQDEVREFFWYHLLYKHAYLFFELCRFSWSPMSTSVHILARMSEQKWLLHLMFGSRYLRRSYRRLQKSSECFTMPVYCKYFKTRGANKQQALIVGHAFFYKLGLTMWRTTRCCAAESLQRITYMVYHKQSIAQTMFTFWRSKKFASWTILKWFRYTQVINQCNAYCWHRTLTIFSYQTTRWIDKSSSWSR